jgi:hypothetical protein
MAGPPRGHRRFQPSLSLVDAANPAACAAVGHRFDMADDTKEQNWLYEAVL